MLMTTQCSERIVIILFLCTVLLVLFLYCSISRCIPFIRVTLAVTHAVSYLRCRTPPPGSTLTPGSHRLAVGQQFEQQRSTLSEGWGTSVPSLPWGEGRPWPQAWLAHPGAKSKKRLDTGERMLGFNILQWFSFPFQSKANVNPIVNSTISLHKLCLISLIFHFKPKLQ